VENLKQLVLDKLDELRAMNERLREGYVPVSVITNLNKTIKDIDVRLIFSFIGRINFNILITFFS
jgi:hypothetical protein